MSIVLVRNTIIGWVVEVAYQTTEAFELRLLVVSLTNLCSIVRYVQGMLERLSVSLAESVCSSARNLSMARLGCFCQ